MAHPPNCKHWFFRSADDGETWFCEACGVAEAVMSVDEVADYLGVPRA